MLRAGIRGLDVFKTVVERRGVNAAADHHGISQPSVTAHLRALARTRIGAIGGQGRPCSRWSAASPGKYRPVPRSKLTGPTSTATILPENGGSSGECRMTALRALLTLGCSILVASVAAVQSFSASAKDFYQGKILELVVAEGVGGGSDTVSRLVGRYIGRYLPGNPTVVIRNMPGAGGLAAANYLYNIAARDGTSIGMLDQSIYETQLFKTEGLLADVTKFNWLGRIMSNNAVLVAWHAAAVKKIEDAYQTELVVSATGLSSLMRWTMLKKLTGMKLKLIVGHQGTSEASLAMERGEVDAFSIPWIVFRVAHADWLRDKQVNILLQTGLDRAADLPDVPRVADLASNAEQRQILELFSQPERVGRSLAAPPELPEERVAELRAAFTATLQDPDFRSEVKSRQLNLDPLTGEELQEIIVKSFDYSPELVEKAEALAKLD
jgi:tripartite-type tricarboxylate transporter receptor subunit TctC